MTDKCRHPSWKVSGFSTLGDEQGLTLTCDECGKKEWFSAEEARPLNIPGVTRNMNDDNQNS